MPRGSRISREQENRVAGDFIYLWEDTIDEFVERVSNERNSLSSYMTHLRGFRPKQYQVDYYVNRLNVPNSLIQLFLNVSPAMISIVGTQRDVYRDTMVRIMRAGGRLSDQMNQRVAKNMAFAIALAGEISSSDNNLPNWRKPSGMQDAEWVSLKRYIESGVIFGESEREGSIINRANANAPEVAEVVEDDAFVDMDGEVAVGEVSSTPEMTEEEAEVVAFDTENAGVSSTTNPSELSYLEMAPVTGIYPEWVNTNWRTTPLSRLVNELRLALALQEVGWSRDKIKKLLFFINRRKLTVSGLSRALVLRGETTSHRNTREPTFLTINIQAKESSSSRFNGATMNRQIKSWFQDDSFVQEWYRTGGGANLRTTRFTGRGINLRGTLALPYAYSINDPRFNGWESFPTFERTRQQYEGINQVEGSGTSSPTISLTEAVSSTHQQYYFLGVAFAPSGSLYNNETISSRELRNLGSQGSAGRVYVFWFGKIDVSAEGGIQLYQLQWGSGTGMTSADSSGISYVSNLDSYFLAQGSRLSTPNTLQLFKISNGSATGTALLSETIYPPITPTFFTHTAEASFNLLTDTFKLPSRAFNALREASQNVITAGGASLTNAKLKAIAEKPFLETNTIGYEFEGGHPDLSMRRLASAYQNLGANVQAEGYNHTTRPQWKLVPDVTVASLPNPYELVSPILTGTDGLEELERVLRVSQELGCEIYKQGGVHVHFGCNGWDLQTKKNILINQYIMSKWLQATQPKHRRNNRWAKPFSTISNTLPEWKARVEGATNERGLTSVVGNDRYCEINITNTRQPTWEWRFPQGNIEVDTNLNMIKLLDKIIEASKEGVLSPENVNEDNMKKWMGVSLFTFWRNRIYDLSQTDSPQPSYNHGSLI